MNHTLDRFKLLWSYNNITSLAKHPKIWSCDEFFERRRERLHWLLHKKDYIYKILSSHDFCYIPRYFIIVTPIESIFRVAVHNIYFREITSIKPIQNERSIWSPMRTFFVSTRSSLYEFYATQIKEHIAGPLNLFDHCACNSSLLLRPQLWDIVAFLTWSGSVLFAFGNRSTQRLVVQRRDWWSSSVTTS